MSNAKAYEHARKRQVVFVDWRPETTLPTIHALQTTIIVGKMDLCASNRRRSLQSPRTPSNVPSRRSSLRSNDSVPKARPPFINNKPMQSVVRKLREKIVLPPMQNEPKPKANEPESAPNEQDLLNATFTSEMGTIAKIYHAIGKPAVLKDKKDEVKVNQETLDLLSKIKQSVRATSIGPVPLSQQACRFELPSDLKLLETLTPLQYLTKYCRLSSRRQYQFKRLFNKYRNARYLFESSDLFLSIVDIHHENFTRTKFADLCQFIDLGSQQHEFTVQTYGGILAFCERMLYNTTPSYKNYDDNQLTKDTIEKCDFDSLERKLDGLSISETMKRLLYAL